MIEQHSRDLPVFALHSRSSSCILGVYRERSLMQLHFGSRMPLPQRSEWLEPRAWRGFETEDLPDSNRVSSNYLPVACSLFGGGDYRPATLEIRRADGLPVIEMGYSRCEILSGFPQPRGLPGITPESGDIETLMLEFTASLDPAGEGLDPGSAGSDAAVGLIIRHYYTVIPELDIFLRWTALENRSGMDCRIERAISLTLPLPHDGEDWQLITLDGAYVRERHVHRRPMGPGITAVGSTRGISSHRHNPWCALVRPRTGEHSGEAIACGLVYSGDFLLEAERDDQDSLRLNAGMHPDTTSITLGPGERMETPLAAFTHSREGLNSISQRFHGLVRDYLMPRPWRRRSRPVLVNNWEATYFDFRADDIYAIAASARELGVELMVLDDGWFGRRDDDTTSLGDWEVDERKLPDGLAALAERIHGLDMQFGLWIEPEMVSPQSRLYREHPDWCLHIPGQPRLQGRHQLVLDLSREDVRREISARIRRTLDSVPLDYIKWDMNRYLAAVGSAGRTAREQGAVAVRHTRGVYALLQELTSAYPQILFEGCSGGGGRFDLGMLAYFPQYWTSDNTDAVSRLKIQYGTSMVYPPDTMGAHVAAVPGHQVGRVTPLSFRSMVAMGGSYGLEFDVRNLAAPEREFLAREIAWYKQHRELLQTGRFYRLESPFEGPAASWIFVAADRRQAAAFRFIPHAEGNRGGCFWRLTGLDSQAMYTLVLQYTAPDGISLQEHRPAEPLSGAELMYRGLYQPPAEQEYHGTRVVLAQ